MLEVTFNREALLADFDALGLVAQGRSEGGDFWVVLACRQHFVCRRQTPD